MRTRIDAERLIPGRGDPIAHGTVVIEDDTIVYAGPTTDAPDAPDAERFTVPTVMPGMWDCHGHFTGIVRPDIMETLTTPMALAAVRAAGDARRALMAGFTSVREVGGMGVELARAVEEHTIEGPTIYGAGAVLSQTGGHGDVHSLPIHWVTDPAMEGWLSAICDGVAECRKAVRAQLRRNAKVIKICASGGVMSEVDDPIHQQFSGEELQAIVEEAARADRAVAAHCHGKPGIMAALEAGVTTIEHGTYLDDEAADAMVETGAILVATRFIVEQLLLIGQRPGAMPDYAYRKILAIAQRHREAIELAIERGVRIATGTDIFVTGDLWGQNGLELVYLVEAGMTPLQAVEAATANGPATLGPLAPRSGLLAEDHDADVIAVDGDPSSDVSVLADPSRILHVWRQGHHVKGAHG